MARQRKEIPMRLNELIELAMRGVGMNEAQILREAAARVRQGWTQGHAGNIRTGICAYGAVSLVCQVYLSPSFSRQTDAAVRALEALKRGLGLPLGGGFGAIYHWNDAPGQTAENVAAGLEYAALVWEQEQAGVASHPLAL
jgi:hypothetical protein